ncbi:MAG: flagellar motor protein MotB [Pseudomonadota bacterium]|nr:flagellar motor protein MotB [Pseudomonadota bacterium]
MSDKKPLVRRVLIARNDTTVLQFLSLYLLVLAFFILLVTISTVDKDKVDAVVDSIKSDAEIDKKQSGPILAGQVFQDKTTELFATALGVQKIEIMQLGKIMRIQMTADALFEPERAITKKSQQPLIDRVIAALSSRPPGYQFDMEFVIGSAYSTGQILPTQQTLEMRRAGAFVREMLNRGAPPDAVSIGMGHIDKGQAVMWFYVRSPNDAKKFYKRLIAPPEE